MDALRKMTQLPAKRPEHVAPQMARKGRVAVGSDADLIVFDPGQVIDRATYEAPDRYSAGIVAGMMREGDTGRPLNRKVDAFLRETGFATKITSQGLHINAEWGRADGHVYAWRDSCAGSSGSLASRR